MPKKPLPAWVKPVLFLVVLFLATIAALALLQFALSYGISPSH